MTAVTFDAGRITPATRPAGAFTAATAVAGRSVRKFVRTPQLLLISTVTGAMFLLIFPLSFVSSAMVPVDTMPGWMQPVAENQPITVMVNAVRSLVLGDPSLAGLPGSTSHYVVLSLVWAAGLVAVFAPLAVLKYRRA